jgi:deazaflavin-dependent oxidoreductase (nitroreductase family)
VNAGSQRTGRGSPGILEPVAPSLIVKVVLRPMTKMLNPLIRKLAGRPHFRMAAQIRHTGRRSGRPYMTPAGARRSGDLIVIPLTFGNQSDWSRNVRAAGGCSIRLNGQDYDTTEPEFLSAQQAKPLVRAVFSPLERASFKVLGIRQFMRLHIVPDGARAGARPQPRNDTPR